MISQSGTYYLDFVDFAGIMVVYYLITLGIAIWAYKDAQRRNMENIWVWPLTMFCCTPFCGLIFYLMSRSATAQGGNPQLENSNSGYFGGQPQYGNQPQYGSQPQYGNQPQYGTGSSPNTGSTHRPNPQYSTQNSSTTRPQQPNQTSRPNTNTIIPSQSDSANVSTSFQGSAKFCQFCGGETEPSAKFCPICGGKILN